MKSMVTIPRAEYESLLASREDLLDIAVYDHAMAKGGESITDAAVGRILDADHPAASSGAQREKLGTLPYDLVPFQEITDSYARVAEYGSRKYAPWNWAKGLPRVQLIGSLLRHTFAYLRGQEVDPETGLSHADHILWNAVALVHNIAHDLEDGRRPDPTLDRDESQK